LQCSNCHFIHNLPIIFTGKNEWHDLRQAIKTNLNRFPGVLRLLHQPKK
jgi:hypothetical protein